MAEKVCLQPCNGLTSVVGTIIRQASYLVHEDLRPTTTVLGCNPALFNDVEEDILFITDYPVIAIEGCERECASTLVRAKGQEATRIIRADQVLQVESLSLETENPANLGTAGQDAVKILSGMVARHVDELIYENSKEVIGGK